MGVKVRRVVMQSVSETDGNAGMKFLGESPHNFLQTGMQNLVGIDPSGHQHVVLFFRHGEDRPVRNHRALCLRRKSFEMSLPGFRNAALAFRIRKLCGSRASPVRI